MNIKKEIKEHGYEYVRQNLNLTIEQVAVACGVSHRTVTRWEKSNNIPKFRDKKNVVKCFESELERGES